MSEPGKAYVIHLARAQERRDAVAAIMQNAPCSIQIHPAADAAAMEPDALAAELSPAALTWPAYRLSLKPGEIGCFLSHRAVWHKIANSQDKWGMIYEDDAVIDPRQHHAAFALALNWIDRIGIIQFQTRPLKGGRRLIAQNAGAALMRPRVPPRRTTAILYSHRAAVRLCQISAQIDRPVDNFLQLAWLTGLDTGVVEPSGVAELSATLGSSIQGGDAKMAKLKRELYRPIYRSAVALRCTLFGWGQPR